MDATDFSDDEFMQTIDFDALELMASSATSTHELAQMNLNVKTPNFEDEKPWRFAMVNDADMKRFQEANQEEN